jgi:hypothetical protein
MEKGANMSAFWKFSFGCCGTKVSYECGLFLSLSFIFNHIDSSDDDSDEDSVDFDDYSDSDDDSEDYVIKL